MGQNRALVIMALHFPITLTILLSLDLLQTKFPIVTCLLLMKVEGKCYNPSSFTDSLVVCVCDC